MADSNKKSRKKVKPFEVAYKGFIDEYCTIKGFHVVHAATSNEAMRLTREWAHNEYGCGFIHCLSCEPILLQEVQG